MAFLVELHDARALCAGPWLISGDFYMIAMAPDKSNNRLDCGMISRFRRFIADEELLDIYLHGCLYTWSSERETPILERINRALCTSGWAVAWWIWKQ